MSESTAHLTPSRPVRKNKWPTAKNYECSVVAKRHARTASPAKVTRFGVGSIVYFMMENHSLGNAARIAGLCAIAVLTGKVAAICSHTS